MEFNLTSPFFGDLEPGATRDQSEAAMRGRVQAATVLTGIYER